MRFYSHIITGLVCCCCLSAAFSQQSGSTDIYSYENSALYAGYLVKSGQYELASRELERLVFMRPANDSLKLSLIGTYRKGGLYQRGAGRVEEFFPQPASMPGDFAVEYARMLLLDNAMERADAFALANENLDNRQRLLFRLNASLRSMDWQKARDQLDAQDDSTRQAFREYDALVNELLDTRRKRPLLALGFSALVPGSGKLYTKNRADALLSFITVGALSWQAYSGFSKQGVSSGYGWAFGVLAFGFYIGNLYGSYKAAKKYNEKIDQRGYHMAEELFDRSF